MKVQDWSRTLTGTQLSTFAESRARLTVSSTQTEETVRRSSSPAVRSIKPRSLKAPTAALLQLRVRVRVRVPDLDQRPSAGHRSGEKKLFSARVEKISTVGVGAT